MPDSGPGEAGRRARDAGRHAHRPRVAGGRRRALPGGRKARNQADYRLRGLRRGRPHEARARVRAPHAFGRVERGLREPDQARLGRLPRGLLLQAARRLGAPRPLLDRARRALGLHVGARVEGAPRREHARRPGRARAPARRLRRRLHVRRAAERGARAAGRPLPRADRARRGSRAAARRDRRRPLPPPRGRRRARGAPLHPVGRHALEPEPLALRDRPVLLQDARGDGARLPGPPGGDGAHARGRRALQRDHGARADPAPDVPGSGRARGVRLPRRAVREGPPAPLRARDAGAHRAPQVRAEDDQGDGVRGLLPDRLGLHPVRQARRGRRRSRTRLGGRLARRLLPGNHGYRPDPLRPPVRAVPEPGAQVDARHRHRFLRPRARPRHQLRGRQVRPRPGRADHHLRDDDGPRRRARRRPRARRPVRPGRPDREAHPRRARRSTSRSR